MPTRFPHATVVRLEENYRSTPQVLALANRLVPQARRRREGAARGAAPTGRSRSCAPFASPEDEGARDRRARSASLDCPLEEVAILCRTNARLTDFEEVLHDAGIPFQGASLLERDAARRLVAPARAARARTRPRRCAARRSRRAGSRSLPDKLGERELVRQTDLARLVALAAAFDGDAAAFVADLRQRFDPGGDGARGVNLLTLHRAKGLEFEAVFLPRLQEKELPSRQARTRRGDRRGAAAALRRADAREARALADLGGKRSRFLAELGVDARSSPTRGRRASEWTPVGERLRAWRLERAREDGVPPYVVFHDSVLHAIADARPSSLGELAQIAGVGPAKLERYGEAVLALVER